MEYLSIYNECSMIESVWRHTEPKYKFHSRFGFRQLSVLALGRIDDWRWENSCRITINFLMWKGAIIPSWSDICHPWNQVSKVNWKHHTLPWLIGHVVRCDSAVCRVTSATIRPELHDSDSWQWRYRQNGCWIIKSCVMMVVHQSTGYIPQSQHFAASSCA